MPHLENWAVVDVPKDEWQAPELWRVCLHGFVSGHPRFDDGDPITTSRIVQTQDGEATTQSGTIYTLGVVDPVYEKAFPDAYKRLFGY